ncbi:MAG: hypothetical protein LBU67_05280 [Oscillospiraceae bacterium]|jgi:hypothetical protein|nr:hypothetical protein [Oscillospiraceae bacterium]
MDPLQLENGHTLHAAYPIAPVLGQCRGCGGDIEAGEAVYELPLGDWAHEAYGCAVRALDADYQAIPLRAARCAGCGERLFAGQALWRLEGDYHRREDCIRRFLRQCHRLAEKEDAHAQDD